MSDPNLFDGKPVIEFDNGSDRRNFLKYAGIVGVGATLTVAGLSERFALSQQGGGGDAEILNYALTLEQLEAEFYRRGIEAGILSGREQELVTAIRDHEVAHVEAVTAAVSAAGGTPVAQPEFRLPEEVFADRAAFLTQASAFEELGVTAYHGQVPLIQSAEVLGAAAAIAGIESRHAAILADLQGGDPFPATVEAAQSMEQVLAAAEPFLPA